jgi:hypothetical protein
MLDLAQARLKELYSYDPLTGLFTHLRRPERQVGNKAHGYVYINIDGHGYRAHRLAWLYVHGHMPDMVDHINGIRDDNRIANLRPVDCQGNLANRRSNKSSRLGIKGVSIKKGSIRSPYCAFITVNKKRIQIGVFATADEAAHAYNKAAIKHFGEYACLNPIGVDK